MLIICLWLIIVFSARSEEIVIRIVTSPSEQEYQDLLSLQNVKLSCPCKRISIPYSTFIKVSTSFHQVCASDFVDDPWIDFLFGRGLWGFHYTFDIRGRGAAFFSLLSVLCSSSQVSINKATKEFLEKVSINAQPTSESDFQLQSDAIIHRFLTSTNDNIGRIFHMMHTYLYSNSFLSGYLLNWNLWIRDIYYKSPSIITVPNKLNNGTCSCATRSDCKEPFGIYGIFETIPHWVIPGLYVACSIYDSLMQSTLECFYSQECIELLQAYATTVEPITAPPRNNITFKQLDSIRPSIYRMNTSILELVNELFVENWIINVSYSAFYNQCSPVHCSYTMRSPSSLLYIVSQILGLYGGVTLVLRLIIPRAVMVYFIVFNRLIRNRRITLFSQRRT